MEIEQNALIDELTALTEEAIAAAYNFRLLPERTLNFKKSAPEWSILECLEHLNLYGDYYLPEIQKRLLSTEFHVGKEVFKSGIIGNYFANLIKVKNGKVKKMRTTKDKDPNNSKLTITTIDRFLGQLESLKVLLNQSRSVHLTRIKTNISLTRFIKLKLGDTLRFVVYHNERHVLQALRTWQTNE